MLSSNLSIDKYSEILKFLEKGLYDGYVTPQISQIETSEELDSGSTAQRQDISPASRLDAANLFTATRPNHPPRFATTTVATQSLKNEVVPVSAEETEEEEDIVPEIAPVALPEETEEDIVIGRAHV